jgi:PAS domain S-box-containing protein
MAHTKVSVGETDFRSIAEHIPDFVGRYAPDGTVLYLNPSVIGFVGKPREALIGDSLASCSEQYEPFRQALKSVCETGLMQELETELIGGSGMKATHYLRFIPETDAARRIASVLVIGHDITEQKQLEHTLRFVAQRGWASGEEPFTTALVRHLGEALAADYVIIDKLADEPGVAETVALYAKGSVVPNMRYDLAGTPCENVVACRLCCYSTDVQALFPSDTLLVEMGIDSYVGVPLWDSDGKVFGLIAVMDGKPLGPRQDMARKLLQIVATRAAAELERDRARAEAERQHAERLRLEGHIQEARKLESLGRFAGGIAHDFNNILGAIIGFSRFITEDLPRDHRTWRYANRILLAGERGRKLVDSILTFARKRETPRTRVSVPRLVRDCLPMLKVAIPSSLRLDLHAPDIAATIEADPTQVDQVLINLCLNARDAMESRTGTITIAVDTLAADHPLLVRGAAAPAEGTAAFEVWTEDDGTVAALAGRCAAGAAHVRLSVRDHGTGMSVPVLSRVFEPFFTTKETGRGTGLGLSAVHGIVMDHAGLISVRSRLGDGTDFSVLFPLVETGLPAEPARPASAAPVPRGCSGRILVVDDDDDSCEVLCIMLQQRGWPVTRKTDSRAAFEAFVAEPGSWTAVFTDRIMPDLRGEELIARLREIRDDLPVVLCTGYGAATAAEQWEGLPPDAILAKPVDPGALDEVLDRLLG